MLNRRALLILLTVGLIKKHGIYKWVNSFQSRNTQEDEWKLNEIYVILQQNVNVIHTSKYANMVDLASWKSNVDKIDNDKLKNVSSNWSNLKSEVDKLDVDKLEHLSIDFQ